MSLTGAESFKGIGIGWVWSAYNLLMLSIALLILVDIPHTSPDEWYELRRTITFQAHRFLFGRRETVRAIAVSQP